MTVLDVVQFFGRQHFTTVVDTDTLYELMHSLHEMQQHFAVVVRCDSSDESVSALTVRL